MQRTSARGAAAYAGRPPSHWGIDRMSRQRMNACSNKNLKQFHAARTFSPALAAALLTILLPAAAQTPAARPSCSVVQAGRLLDRPGHAARGASTLLVCGGRV